MIRLLKERILGGHSNPATTLGPLESELMQILSRGESNAP